MADFEVLNLDSISLGSIVDIHTQDAKSSYDRLQTIVSSAQPYVQLLTLDGLSVLGDPVQVLGACSKESYMYRAVNQLPEDLVEGVIMGGMRYLMRTSNGGLFISPNLVSEAKVMGVKKLTKAQKEFVPRILSNRDKKSKEL